GDFRVQASKEGGVLRGTLLAQPENRLFACLIGGALVGGIVAQDLGGAGVVDLRQRKDRLVLKLGIRGAAQDRVEGGHGTVAPYLRQPEHRLLAHLGIGVVAGDVEQDVFRFATMLLGYDEDRLAPQSGGACIALRQDFLEDGERVGRVHLEETVQRGDSDVVLVILIGTAARAHRLRGLRRLRGLCRLRVLGEPGGRLAVALLRERRLNPGEQRVAVAQRRRFGVSLLLGEQQAARAYQIVVLVERESRPVEGVAGPGGVRVPAREIGVEFPGARVVTTVECLPRRTPQRVSGVLLILEQGAVPWAQRVERVQDIEPFERVQGIERTEGGERVERLERRLRVRQRGCDRTWHNRLLHSQDGRDHQIHRLHHNAPCVRTGPGPAGFAVRSRSNTLRWSNPWLIDCTSSRSPPPPAGSWAICASTSSRSSSRPFNRASLAAGESSMSRVVASRSRACLENWTAGTLGERASAWKPVSSASVRARYCAAATR